MSKRDERLDLLELFVSQIASKLEQVITATLDEGRRIGKEEGIPVDVPERVGFALFMFDFNEKGWMTYASNATREDMLEALKEFIAKEEAGIVTPHGAPVTTEH